MGKGFLNLTPILLTTTGGTAATNAANTDIDLIEPLFNGLVGKVYNIVASSLTTIIQLCAKSYRATSLAFYELIGKTGNTYNSDVFNVFYWIGTLLLVFLLVYSLIIVSMGPLTEQKNDVFELLFRFVISLVLICTIKEILWLICETETALVNRFGSQGIDTINNMTGEIGLDPTGAVTMALESIVVSIIFIIIWLAIIIEFIKFFLEIIERYLVVQLLVISSPTVAATYVSRTTSSILTNFFRMFLSQLFLLLMNEVFLFLGAIMAANMIASASGTIGNAMILLVTLKCAQRLDSYMKSMGLTVAQTGGVILDSIAGAVATMGAAMKMGKNGAVLTGSALEAAGAAGGNFGMASLGTKLKNVATGDFANHNAKSLDNFAKNGGYGNVNRKDSDQMMAAKTGLLSALSSGNLQAFNRAPVDLQTEALKSALTQNGDAIAKATGGLLKAGDIKQASLNPKTGDISGLIKHTDAVGKTHTSAFSAKVNPSGRDAFVGAQLSDIGDGASRTLNIQSNSSELGNYSVGCDFGSLSSDQMSPVTALYGVSTDNNTLANLGVDRAEIANGNITYYSNDNAMGYQNIESGSFAEIGENQTFSKAEVMEHFANNPQYNQYMPEDAFVIPDTIVSGEQGTCFDITSNESGGKSIYKVQINNVRPQDLEPKAKGHVVNDVEYGYKHITVVQKKQSSTEISN